MNTRMIAAIESMNWNFRLGTFCVMLLVVTVGCTAPWVKRDAESESAKRNKEIKQLLASEKRPRLIGDAATISGLGSQQFEAFGIVSSLPGTGGDIKAGPQRDYVLREMRVLEAENPNAVLASNTTAVVKARASIRPGVQAGERVDVIIEKSSDCDAKDLRNGWLMPTRLLDLVTAGGSIRQSDLKANATGPLVTFPASLNSTKNLDKELAVVLGGAQVVDDQLAYLRLNESVRHTKTSIEVAKAINERFEIFYKGELRGVAESKTDRTIELLVPSKYRHDLGHYVETVMSIGFMDEGTARADRLKASVELLKDPITARRGTLQLEAIGEEGIPGLRTALQSPDKEIRFYAAYALAHLDDDQAVAVLVELARKESAFRPMALLGLAVIEKSSGEEALRSLISEQEPELCYGALRQLRNRKSFDSVATGQMLASLGRVSEIAGPHKMVAVSLELEPEIAIFGGSIPVSLDTYYEVNSRMTMRNENGSIRVVHFQPNDEDLTAFAEPNLRSILDAFNAVQATYSDAIIFLDEAQKQQWITVPVKFNPIPHPGRKFNRLTGDSEAEPVLLKADVVQDESTKPVYAWWDLNRYFQP